MNTQSKYEQFTQTSYSGRQLLQKHSLSEEGIWQVYGEDSNADLHGSHHQPLLGIYQGKLQDVIRHAVLMSGFWQWGAGGDIKKITISTIDMTHVEAKEAEERSQLLAKAEQERARLLQQMERERAQIDAKINQLRK